MAGPDSGYRSATANRVSCVASPRRCGKSGTTAPTSRNSSPMLCVFSNSIWWREQPFQRFLGRLLRVEADRPVRIHRGAPDHLCDSEGVTRLGEPLRDIVPPDLLGGWRRPRLPPPIRLTPLRPAHTCPLPPPPASPP